MMTTTIGTHSRGHPDESDDQMPITKTHGGRSKDKRVSAMSLGVPIEEKTTPMNGRLKPASSPCSSFGSPIGGFLDDLEGQPPVGRRHHHRPEATGGPPFRRRGKARNDAPQRKQDQGGYRYKPDKNSRQM